MKQDFYATLGLAPGAAPDDIKKAYRRLSKEWHPDRHKGDKTAEKRFKEINEAYEVLSHAERKKMYDTYGTTGKGTGGAGPFGGFDFNHFTKGFGDFGDIFESFFGQQTEQARGGGSGGDREVTITLDLVDAFTGIEKALSLQKFLPCHVCNSSGSRNGKRARCTSCSGTGQVVHSTQSFFGVIQQRAICSQCRGVGTVPESPCEECGGQGIREATTTVTLRIPPGIADGQTLRIRGEGDAGREGAKAGDLFVHVQVTPDPRFVRDGNDIRSILTIPVSMAILGGDIDLQTLHGTVTLHIPEGTQHGNVLRLRGKGMPVVGSSRFGDHYADIRIAIPTKLSRAERKILEEWSRLQ